MSTPPLPLTKATTRALWSDFCAASRDYLVAPTPVPLPLAPIVRSSSLPPVPPPKKPKIETPAVSPSAVSKLIVCTRMNPKFVERYAVTAGMEEEIHSREDWETDAPSVFGLDCEMIETNEDNMALARLSVVELNSWVDGKIVKVLDVLVKSVQSKDYIVDCRTSITGLTAEEIMSKGIPLEAAKVKFKELLKPNSILIGHALDHDLLALGIRYTRVVDTAFLFAVPGNTETSMLTHSLAHLARCVLDKDTNRAENQGSHDSVEDATLAVEICRKLLCDPSWKKVTLPFILPREESGAKRKLMAGANPHLAKALAVRVAAADSTAKSAVRDLQFKR